MVDVTLVAEKEAHLKKKGWKRDGKLWRNPDMVHFGPASYCTDDAYRVQIDFERRGRC
jgi:hypothetical protein